MGRKLVVPILVIVVGVAWLLNVLGIMPGVDWLWTGGLAIVGILCLVIGGLNRVSVVIGPFLLGAALCSWLRQTGQLPIEREVPILVIVLGVLLLVAQLSRLPMPEILRDDPKPEGKPD